MVLDAICLKPRPEGLRFANPDANVAPGEVRNEFLRDERRTVPICLGVELAIKQTADQAAVLRELQSLFSSSTGKGGFFDPAKSKPKRTITTKEIVDLAIRMPGVVTTSVFDLRRASDVFNSRNANSSLSKGELHLLRNESSFVLHLPIRARIVQETDKEQSKTATPCPRYMFYNRVPK